MYTTPPTLTAVRTPSSPAEPDPWMIWRTDTPAEPDVLTVAELAECCCPDLCDRDHANE